MINIVILRKEIHFLVRMQAIPIINNVIFIKCIFNRQQKVLEMYWIVNFKTKYWSQLLLFFLWELRDFETKIILILTQIKKKITIIQKKKAERKN